MSNKIGVQYRQKEIKWKDKPQERKNRTNHFRFLYKYLRQNLDDVFGGATTKSSPFKHSKSNEFITINFSQTHLSFEIEFGIAKHFKKVIIIKNQTHTHTHAPKEQCSQIETAKEKKVEREETENERHYTDHFWLLFKKLGRGKKWLMSINHHSHFPLILFDFYLPISGSI